MNRWLSFYYPTTVVFVDDEKNFLLALQNRIPSDLSCKLFHNPMEALDFIDSGKSLISNKLEHPFLLDDQLNESEPDILGVGVKFDSFVQSIYDLNRFSTLSVVIVDYMMPELNGIDFCKRLNGHPIKKIMLTANADHAMAVQALNNGIIDCFLVKDSPNLVAELTQKIDLLQKSYFHGQLDRVFGGLFEKLNLLNDPVVVDFYEKLRKELNAIEFYLLDRFGSVLFVDRNGIAITLAVCSKKDLEVFSQIAEDQDEVEISKKLIEFQKLIFFPNKAACLLPASEWIQYLHPATPFPGNTDLFYAIIKEPLSQPVDIRKICSKSSHEKSQ